VLRTLHNRLTAIRVRRFRAAVLVVAWLLLAGCGAAENQSLPPTAPAWPFTPIARRSTPTRVPVVPTSTPADGVPRIVVGDNYFESPRVVIPVGASVEWVHQGVAMHTVTSAEGKWGVMFLSPGSHTRLVFNTPGVYRYFCSYHPGMTGTIEVVR
jgi:plastocyanin